MTVVVAVVFEVKKISRNAQYQINRKINPSVQHQHTNNKKLILKHSLII